MLTLPASGRNHPLRLASASFRVFVGNNKKKYGGTVFIYFMMKTRAADVIFLWRGGTGF